ncbi:MAG: PilZ domain-containing protein [Bradyrhizobiaceae bacterium]|nr:MAG: PilZ domain-containing protein [Bradyrhizobiaceae bacterium]
MDDHRTVSRRRILEAGTIEFGSTVLPCTVRNLSKSGAALEINSPLWFPDHFIIGIASDGLRRPCHIVWRREKRTGVAFE